MTNRNRLVEYVMTREQQASFNPFTFVEDMRRAGFRFDSEACPVKISKPFECIERDDGCVVWRQWDQPI
jgi:hypothetical protein